MTVHLSSMTWDELTDWAAQENLTPSSYLAVEIEFLRREVLFQKETTDAAKDTAEYTKHNAKYMLWSVVALTISASLQAFALLIPLAMSLHH